VLLSKDDRHGVALTELIRLTIPVHYDDYTTCKSPLSDFVGRTREHGLAGIRPIARGDTVDLLVRDGQSHR
jgi:hypothetical protein